MAEPFATAENLQDGWRPLSDDEKALATSKLGTASRHLRALAPDLDARIAADLLDPELVKDVVCEMVRRAMLAPVDQAPMQQVQFSAGSFSQGGTFTNPTGDIYLTKAERKLLGIGGQQAFTVPMAAPVVDDPLGWLG